MTTIDEAASAVQTHAKSRKSRLPNLSKLRDAMYETVSLTAITLVAGSALGAVLKEPVNTRVIPTVLELFGKGLQVNLYKQSADGALQLDQCYKLLVPPWSSDGTMVEIIDKSVCPAAEPFEEPVQFKTKGSQMGGVMSFSFRHFNNAYGGGAFSGDSLKTPGMYVGTLAGQAHDEGATCVLTQYWAVVGKPDSAPKFQSAVERKIVRPGGAVAILPQPISEENPNCAARHDD